MTIKCRASALPFASASNRWSTDCIASLMDPRNCRLTIVELKTKKTPIVAARRPFCSQALSKLTKQDPVNRPVVFFSQTVSRYLTSRICREHYSTCRNCREHYIIQAGFVAENTTIKTKIVPKQCHPAIWHKDNRSCIVAPGSHFFQKREVSFVFLYYLLLFTCFLTILSRANQSIQKA